MEPAKFLEGLDEGPEDGAAWWATTKDGVRIRVGGWGAGAPKGTILLFPGRTEYIEKYGPNARDFLDSGYATLAVDWRGQGMADRLLPDPQKGHVDKFQDYQHDVEELISSAEKLGFKPPYYLLAHSMGGCIGYRSLHEGLPVQAVVFSAPMWGVLMPPGVKHFAPALMSVGRRLGFGNIYIPSGKPENYVEAQPFEGNTLTNDAEMYAFMQRHLQHCSELGLGGPTYHWLGEALKEMRYILTSDAPQIPTRCYMGTAEKIVDPVSIHDRMGNWPGAELIEISMAEHEVLMETLDIRSRVTREICAFFDEHSA